MFNDLNKVLEESVSKINDNQYESQKELISALNDINSSLIRIATELEAFCLHYWFVKIDEDI